MLRAKVAQYVQHLKAEEHRVVAEMDLQTVGTADDVCMDDQQDPLIAPFADIKPETYVSVTPTDTLLTMPASCARAMLDEPPKHSTRSTTPGFVTSLESIDALRTQTFAQLSAPKNYEDTTIRDLSVLASVIPSCRQQEPAAANPPSPTTPKQPPVTNPRRTSPSWFTEAGGATYFGDFLSIHTDAAANVAEAEASGTVRLGEMNNLVTCVWPQHCAAFFFESWMDGIGPCINDENCVARKCLEHSGADKTAAEIEREHALEIVETKGTAPGFQWNPDAGRGGVIHMTFLNPQERQIYNNTGRVPPRRGPCLACIRDRAGTEEFLAGFDIVTPTPPHYNPVDTPGAYNSGACNRFSSSRAGASQPHQRRPAQTMLPIRYFDATEYIETTLEEAVDQKIVELLPREREMFERRRASGKPPVRGHIEKGCVYFFRVTRWLSPQAMSIGSDSMWTYVPQLAQLPGVQNPLAASSANNVALFAEIAHRTGYTTELVTSVFGIEFSTLCTQIATSTSAVPHRHLQSLRAWERLGTPGSLLESYSIVCALFLRLEMLQDVRRGMAREFELAAFSKHSRANDPATASPLGVAPTNTATTPNLLTTAQVNVERRVRQASATAAAVGASETSVNTNAAKLTSLSGRALKQRKGTVRTGNPFAARPTHASRTDFSRSTLEIADRLLVEIAKISKAHRPLARWIYARIDSRRSVADNALVGTLPTYNESSFRIALGSLRPECFLVPTDLEKDVPIIRVRFPSSREIILAALSPKLRKLPSSEMIGDKGDASVTIEETLDEFFRTLPLYGNDAKRLTQARIALSARILDCISDPTTPLAIHLHRFMWTHLDLAVDGHNLSDINYPFDGRNRIDAASPPLSTILTQCEFFEQNSDPILARSIPHILAKAICRACNIRGARTVTAQACLENHALAMMIVKFVEMTLFGAYPHARTRPKFAQAVQLRQIVRVFEHDVRCRALAYATRYAYRRCLAAERAIPRCIANFTSIDNVLDTIRLFQDVVRVATPVLGGYLLRPFQRAAIAAETVFRDAIVYELTHDRNGTIFEADPSKSDAHVAKFINSADSVDPETRNAILNAIKALSNSGIFGCPLNTDPPGIPFLIDVVVQRFVTSVQRTTCSQLSDKGIEALRGVVTANVVNATARRTTATSFFVVQPADVRDVLKNTLNTALLRFVPTTVGAPKAFCYRVVEGIIDTVGPYMILGLGHLVSQALFLIAPDVLDCEKACLLAFNKVDVTRGNLWTGVITKDVDDALAAPADVDDATFIGAETVLIRMARQMLRRRQTLGLPSVSTAAGDSDTKRPHPGRSACIQRALRAILCQTVYDAANVARACLDFGNAMLDLREMQKKASDYCWSRNEIAKSPYVNAAFVEANSMLVQYSIKEALIAGLSQNGALAEAFSRTKKWFPEFMDHCANVADAIRSAIYSNPGCKLPLDNNVADISMMSRNETWGGQVFRLTRPDQSIRFATAMASVREELEAAGGQCIDSRPNRDLDRRLMFEYLLAQHSAHGSRITDPEANDRAILQTFGLREHGLAIVACMQRAHNESPGNKDLVDMTREFTPSEFALVFDYYNMLYNVNSVRISSLSSREWSESAIASLCEKHSIADGAQIPETIYTLFICDSCASILTQVTPRSRFKHFDLPSCYGACLDRDGRLVCANRRNLCKKDKAEERELVSMIVEHRRRLDKANIAAAATNGEMDTKDTKSVDTNGLRRRRRRVSNAASVNMTNRSATLVAEMCEPGAEAAVCLSSSIIPPCKDLRVRALSGTGRIIGFNRKFKSPREKIIDSKLPLILSPCCGKWMRFSADDWVVDRFMCAACACKNDRICRSNDCSLCGAHLRPITVLGSTGKKSVHELQMYTEMTRRTSRNCAKTIAPQIVDNLQQCMNKHGATSVIIGPHMPVSTGAAGIGFAIEDEITLGLIPISLCRACNDPGCSFITMWPMLYSVLHTRATKRAHESDIRNSLRKSGIYTKGSLSGVVLPPSIKAKHGAR